VRGRRIFLTGGTGFFGTWFLELLTYAADELRFDCEVVVLTRDPAAFARGPARHLAVHRCVQLLTGDVRDFAFPAGPFPLVAHFGSTGPKALLDGAPEEFFDLVVNGTKRVLQLAEQAGTQRLLLASTGAVYGPAPGPSRETDSSAPDPTKPASTNAEAKRVAESLTAGLVRRRPELAAGLARGFAFVGPYLPRDAGFAAQDFLQDVRAGRDIAIKGDGTAVRSYLYGADLAAWLWTILLRTPAGAARAWNVGAEEAVTIRQLADLAAGLGPRPLNVTVAGRAVPGQPPHTYLPDTTRARTELGLAQSVALPEALRRTLAWLEAVA
jgi:dTDP-glucose 4,6-dehydratase